MGMAAYLQQTAIWVLVFVLGYIAFFALSVGPVGCIHPRDTWATRSVRASEESPYSLQPSHDFRQDENANDEIGEAHDRSE